jgi:carboxyl-terminal processing protease
VGSKVTLTVQRSGSADPIAVSIVRAEVQAQYVFYSMLPNTKYADVSITEFHGDVSKTFQEAMKFVKDQKATGMILDLRDNLGGSVKECVDIAKMILPKGLICYTLDKAGKRDEYTADTDGQNSSIPLVVLVNGNTASASEIIAGAIQDDGRGKLVGTQTYGKGVVQSVLDMPYSGGGVKLTSAVYFTPRGRNINGVGLTPDATVDLPADVKSGKAALTADTDTQLKMAIDMMNNLLSGAKASVPASAAASPSAK